LGQGGKKIQGIYPIILGQGGKKIQGIYPIILGQGAKTMKLNEKKKI
jgi:hypothetical protein